MQTDMAMETIYLLQIVPHLLFIALIHPHLAIYQDSLGQRCKLFNN